MFTNVKTQSRTLVSGLVAFSPNNDDTTIPRLNIMIHTYKCDFIHQYHSLQEYFIPTNENPMLALPLALFVVLIKISVLGSKHTRPAGPSLYCHGLARKLLGTVWENILVLVKELLYGFSYECIRDT